MSIPDICHRRHLWRQILPCGGILAWTPKPFTVVGKLYILVKQLYFLCGEKISKNFVRVGKIRGEGEGGHQAKLIELSVLRRAKYRLVAIEIRGDGDASQWRWFNVLSPWTPDHHCVSPPPTQQCSKCWFRNWYQFNSNTGSLGHKTFAFMHLKFGFITTFFMSNFDSKRFLSNWNYPCPPVARCCDSLKSPIIHFWLCYPTKFELIFGFSVLFFLWKTPFSF